MCMSHIQIRVIYVICKIKCPQKCSAIQYFTQSCLGEFLRPTLLLVYTPKIRVWLVKMWSKSHDEEDALMTLHGIMDSGST